MGKTFTLYVVFTIPQLGSAFSNLSSRNQ